LMFALRMAQANQQGPGNAGFRWAPAVHWPCRPQSNPRETEPPKAFHGKQRRGIGTSVNLPNPNNSIVAGAGQPMGIGTEDKCEGPVGRGNQKAFGPNPGIPQADVVVDAARC
jgi:hypothetical protein